MGETTHVEFESDDLDEAFEKLRSTTRIGKPAIYASHALEQLRTNPETGFDVWEPLVSSGGGRATFSKKDARSQSNGHWKNGRSAMMRVYTNVYVSVYVTAAGARLREKFLVGSPKPLPRSNRRRRKSKDEYGSREIPTRHRHRPSRKPGSDEDTVL